MNDKIAAPSPKRKVLSLKLSKQEDERPAPPPPTLPQFVNPGECYYMVWREGGDMPKRLYSPKEQDMAVSHAKKMAAEFGHRFHVLRSFRAYEPEEQA